MNIDLLSNQIIVIFQSFIHSPFFLALKFILAIYVTVLFADIIMLLILRGVGADVRTAFRGSNVPLVSPKKMNKKWRKITSRLEGNDQSQYKLAIIEADSMIDNIFKQMGLKGDDMIQKMDNLNPEQLDIKDDLKEAHKMRNQIIHDPSLQIGKESAKKILDIYATFLLDNEFMK